MRIERSRWRLALIAAGAALCLCTLGGGLALADFEDFEDDLVRIDKALKKNPQRLTKKVLQSCLNRRNYAARLHYQGHVERAERSLRYCFKLLKLPEEPPEETVDYAARTEKAMLEVQARAAEEVEKALALTPDVANGLAIYRECAACHQPEGWGLSGGGVPQIAGQHRKVVIKQLADIRAGNRDTVLMAPYSSATRIGGPQAVADVAAYIDTLEISVENGKGPGTDLALGERLYRENCIGCHGMNGEGDSERYMPRIQSQHYHYLVRQFEWIRDGKRRNGNADMATQIERFDEAETHAVLDYVSRLEPPEEFQAPPGWRNPDFAE